MITARTRPSRNRRGTAVLVLALASSIALHGLAIAALAGWPDGPAPDAAPRVIAVGMVIAEIPIEGPSEEIAQDVRTNAEPTELYEEIEYPTDAGVDAPGPRPVPDFVEGTRLALSIDEAVTDRAEPADPPPMPDPPVFYDEGTQLETQSSLLSPALPGRRPPIPASFRAAERPPTSTAAGQAARPAEHPDPAPSSEASTMALQPARHTGPGLANPAPEYPRSARRRGDEGTVVVRVEVSATGVPDSVQVVTSSGVQSLDAAAAETVRQWRFIPARRGDTAVPAVIDVPIAFRLTDD